MYKNPRISTRAKGQRYMARHEVFDLYINDPNGVRFQDDGKIFRGRDLIGSYKIVSTFTGQTSFGPQEAKAIEVELLDGTVLPAYAFVDEINGRLWKICQNLAYVVR
jgi:hypothetical protein